MDASELDVRTIPPRDRHPLIFATFDRLAPGESFTLVNDHDPRPLYYQFQAERAGEVSWEPQEEGPDQWVVRIRKLAVETSSAPPPAGALPTQPLRDEHQELLPHIGRLRELGDAAGGHEVASTDVKSLLEEVTGFLSGHLLVHAQAEEKVMYPAVGSLMGAPQATATMSRDHVEIERLTAELQEAQRGIGDSDPTADDLASIRRLAYGLSALVTVHFAKEEEVYLPLLDAALTPERAHELFVAMERAAAEARQA
jgi:uncharacterized protein (DUF2249 family)/hemerythrin-like domain-containing protein